MGSTASVSVVPSDMTLLLDIFNSHREKLSSLFPDTSSQLTDCISENQLVDIIIHHPDICNLLLRWTGSSRIDPYILSLASDCAEVVDIFESKDMSHICVDNSDCSSITDFINQNIAGSQYTLNAESRELESIEFLSLHLRNELFKIRALNLSSNQITADAVAASAMKESSLFQLNIGCNLFYNLSDLVYRLPASLVILDLSYTENIQFSQGVFFSCPQLLHLVLDGCCIETTSYECTDEDIDASEQGNSPISREYASSIFCGLMCLTYLSLRENSLEKASALEGLNYFVKQNLSSEADAIWASNAPMLRHVNFGENPLCDISAEYKAAMQLVRSLPCVHFIDGRVVEKGQDEESSKTPLTFQLPLRPDNEQAVVGVTDAMEAEFNAALRQEQDSTVVS